MEQCFGATILLACGRIIPTRWVGEQHVREDLGFIPTLADWLACIQPQPWMGRGRKLSMEDVPLSTEAAGGPASGAGDGGQTGRQGAPTELWSSLVYGLRRRLAPRQFERLRHRGT